MSGARRVTPAWTGPGPAAPPDPGAPARPAAWPAGAPGRWHPGASGPGREELLPGSQIRRCNLFGIVTRTWQNPPGVIREWSSWVMRGRRTARSLVPGLAADPLGNGGERGA